MFQRKYYPINSLRQRISAIIVPMKVILFSVFFFLASIVRGEVFIVTSNADSGSGTLREAIGKAVTNGSIETDVIQFDLAVPVISLITPLPSLPSKIIVNGSSQPGNSIGLSDAKVEIKLDPGVPYQTQNIGFFTGLNVSDLEIYGFFFSVLANGYRSSSPINLRSCTNIKIGAPGKGNVFGSLEVDVSLTSCDNIKISANWFGLNPQQSGVLSTAFGHPLTMYMCDEIMVGGEVVSEGNIFCGRYYGISITGYNPTTGQVGRKGNSCTIKNNRFGLKGYAGVSDPNYIKDFKTILVQDNICPLSGGFFIERSDLVKVYGNKLGIDEGSIKGQTLTTPLGFDQCEKVVVGGTAEEEKNVLSHGNVYGFGIYSHSCGDVLILGNSIYCVNDQIYYSGQSKVPLPEISVVTILGGVIKGKSTPNARVELFTDGECNTCQAKTLTSSTYADNAGNWEAPAPAGMGFTASATLNSRTSLFLKLQLSLTNVKATDPTCAKSNGSIRGATIINATSVEWRNTAGDIVGTNADLENVPAGTYTLIARIGGGCQTQPYTFTLKDTRPQLFTSNVMITQPACGVKNGSIKNISGNFGSFIFKSLTWRNQNGEIMGSNLDLLNASPGVYTLTLESTGGCSAQAGPFVLNNQGAPLIDNTSQQIIAATCNASNGSVKGLRASGTGTLSYTWKNSKDETVSNNPDLESITGGVYTLEAKNPNGCLSLITVTVPELNSISINAMNASVTESSCNLANGSINGITVNGATAYQWLNEAGDVFSNTTNAELNNAPSGKYRLRASNNNGCVKESAIFEIPRHVSAPFPEYPVIAIRPCADNTGRIEVDFGTANRPAASEWRDRNGKIIGTGSGLNNLSAGEYFLYLTNNEGCVSFYKEYQLAAIAPLEVDLTNLRVEHDKCGLENASISGAIAKNGEGVYTYTWVNEGGEEVGTSINLKDIKAGTYYLKVRDETICSIISTPIKVDYISDQLSSPILTDVSICAAGTAIIRVDNIVEGTYKLYSGMTEPSPLEQNNSGVFTVEVEKSREYYVSYSRGNCESDRKKISIQIASSDLRLPNLFTPNNDGINDTWEISKIDNYPNALVKIYNRYGALVFESRGYHKSFDGRGGGQELPAGAYYYTVELRQGCRILSGNLNIIR